jgi:hypothetical protein
VAGAPANSTVQGCEQGELPGKKINEGQIHYNIVIYMITLKVRPNDNSHITRNQILRYSCSE